MKKSILLLTALTMMMMGTTQTALAQQRKTTGNKAVAKKTVTTQPTINVNFKGELGRFELRGPVKIMEVLNEGGFQGPKHYFNRDGFETDENGKLRASNNDQFIYITRDNKGRIIKEDNQGYGSIAKYEYNANGLLVKYHFERGESNIVNDTYKYNSDGELINEMSTFFQLGEHGKNNKKFTIVSRDSYGNWTERKSTGNYGDEVERRKITYYESAATPASTPAAAPAETTCPLVGDWYGVLGNGWGETTVYLVAEKKVGTNSKMAKRISNGNIDMTDEEFVREWNYNLVFNRTISANTYEFTVQRMVGKQLKQGKLQIRKNGNNITMTGLDAWAKQQPFHGKTLGKPNPVYQ